MEKITRQLAESLQADFFKGKVILLLGARQVGKSTLIRMVTQSTSDHEHTLWLDGENADVQLLLNVPNSERLRQITQGYRLVVIDEAQKIENIGSTLKLFADYLPAVQVIASGSSSFELRNTLNEPLTGRKFEFQLFPLAFSEMAKEHGLLHELRQLPQRLVYGYYPEIVTHTENAERLLKFLAESYLYKDIFLLKNVKRPEKILELLRLLAGQIGSEVSYHELGNTLGMDNQTVESYIHLLEQTFVVYRLPAFHTNQRNELKKSKKIYFNDLGIRNALINDYRPIEIRNDRGALFENFVINELRKQNAYRQVYANLYFWRSTEQKEIDLVVEKNGYLHTFEVKWNADQNASLPRAFSTLYADRVTFQRVHPHNFYELLDFSFVKAVP